MRRLALVAWLSFSTHALAALASLLFLREGTPTGADAAARAGYVAAHLATWRLGWLAWTLASLSLVALLVALHRRSALLAAAGLAFDLPSQLALAIPRFDLERLAYLGTGVAANSIYTAALAWAALAAPIPRALKLACAPIVIAGALVTLASALAHPLLLFVSAGALALGMILWSAALGAWAWHASS